MTYRIKRLSNQDFFEFASFFSRSDALISLFLTYCANEQRSRAVIDSDGNIIYAAIQSYIKKEEETISPEFTLDELMAPVCSKRNRSIPEDTVYLFLRAGNINSIIPDRSDIALQVVHRYFDYDGVNSVDLRDSGVKRNPIKHKIIEIDDSGIAYGHICADSGCYHSVDLLESAISGTSKRFETFARNVVPSIQRAIYANSKISSHLNRH